MKRSLMTLFLLLACSLALAAAQSGQQSSSPSEHGKKVTLTGCLQAGPSPDSFVLNQASSSEMGQRSESQGQYGQGESREQMPEEMARTESTYMLVPEGNVDLQSDVGKRVEITGEMMKSSQRTTESTEATTPSGQTRTTTERTGQQPQVMVRSIRDIAQSCE